LDHGAAQLAPEYVKLEKIPATLTLQEFLVYWIVNVHHADF
jgi:hypothetical protein